MADNFGGTIAYGILGFICIILIMAYKIINKKTSIKADSRTDRSHRFFSIFIAVGIFCFSKRIVILI
jgi:hypothetical protein